MSKNAIKSVEFSVKSDEKIEINIENSEKSKGDEEPADFEKAIVAAGWGKFNWIVYALAVTAGMAPLFETSTMSFVFPIAECDLKLVPEHKGLLNAVTYMGMISSGFIWGYLCDTLGRKKLLVIGFLVDGMFVLMAASSQNFAMLMTAKFFGGFVINGPFSALTTYLSELHNSKQRSRVQMVLGLFFSSATLVLPILAIVVLPLNISTVLSKHFVLHSWNVFLYICSLAPLFSGIAFMFLPESPKFLMTTGRNDKALRVFRKIYRLNTGLPEETYPIKVLINEIEMNQDKRRGKMTANRTKKEALVQGFSQLKPLFRPPYITKILFVCLIQCFTMGSLNTLRLWIPQLFQAANDYQQNHNDTAPLCVMLEVFRPKNKTISATGEAECIVNTNNYSVYINTIIVAMATILAYSLAGLVIHKVGKKRLYILLGLSSGTMAYSLYFANSMIITIVLSCIFIGTGSVMINTILAIIVDLFPTTLRTMTVSLAMMCGRTGAVLGNVIFPLLLEAGCAPPFFYVGTASFMCALLGVLLPNTEQKALE